MRRGISLKKVDASRSDGACLHPMATFKEDMTLRLTSNKDAETESVDFHAGDHVHVTHEWARFYLVRDDNGHYFNVPKDKITK